MDIQDLQTPAFLADLDVMENNLKRAADAALKYQKQIWPMIKTHKSTELALLQKQYGCTGFLCGTLDEAEALAKAGLGPIMYAYPVASENAIRRVTALSKCCRLILRLDDPASAALVERYAQEEQITLDYTIIVDCGLHRFGVPPEEAGCFAEDLRQFPHLCFKGISTHPGHVYASRTASVWRSHSNGRKRDLCRKLFPAALRLPSLMPSQTRTYRSIIPGTIYSVIISRCLSVRQKRRIVR